MNLIAYRILRYLLHLMHRIWEAFTHIIWKIDGTAAKVKNLINGNEDSFSAQVLKVVWTSPLETLTSPQTFFTIHEKFAPADIVLNDRVHLLSVTSRSATFTEVSCDMLDVRKYPFNFIAQTKFTTRLIILPIKVFYDLVDKIDVSDRKAVFMFHTIRCGSTAWVQAFNSLPEYTVFSEPQGIWYGVMYGDHGYFSAESFSKTPEYKRMATAAIKLHLRHAPSNGSVFLKTSVFAEYLVNTIAEAFPQHKMLVAYRDFFPSCTSWTGSFNNVLNFRHYTEILLNHDPDDDKWWAHLPNTSGWTSGCDHIFCKKVLQKVQPKSGIEWFCFLWAAKVSVIRQQILNGAKIKCVKYDDLLENKKETVAKVFDYLDIPSECVDIACDALNDDSQAGVAMVSWNNRKKDGRDEWSKDEEVVKRCNLILEEFDCSDIHTPLSLPNSL